MGSDIFTNLRINEVDVDGALHRLYDDENLYVELLRDFGQDTTVTNLKTAIQNKDWDNAFTAAHALKGLAANMGFVLLFQSISELIVLIRTGRIDEIGPILRAVDYDYKKIIDIIQNSSIMIEGE